MAVTAIKGVLTAPAATGAQSITLPAGSAPKVIIAWATFETADTSGSSGTDGDGIFAFGCATYDASTVQQWHVSSFEDDAAATSTTVSNFNTDALLKAVTADGTAVDYVVTLTSMSDTSVDLNWSDVPASQIRIHYLILGGSDITAARAGSIIAVTTGVAQSQTVAASWGQPDLLMFGTTSWSVTGVTQNDTALGLGWAKSDSERQSVLYKSEDAIGAAGETVGAWSKARALLFFNSALATGGEMDLDARASWPTDGFQITWPVACAAAARIGWLALKGTFTSTIGSTTAPTAAPTVDQDLAIASGVPNAAFLWGHMIPTDTTIDTTHGDLGGFFIGATDGTNEGCAAIVQDDGNANAASGRAFTSAKAIQHWTAAAGGGAPSLQSEADSSITGSNVRLSWNDTDSTARTFKYLLIGSAATGATVTAPALDSVGDVPAPTVTGGATITSPVLDGVGDIANPVLSAGVLITSPPLDGVGDIANPVVAIGAEVTAPPLDATGDVVGNLPISVEVVAVALDSTGDIPAPVVGTGVTVVSPALDGTGDIVVPTLTTGANVTSPPLDGVGDVVSPTTIVSITSPPLDATGDVVGNLPISVEVVAVALDSTGDVSAPVVSVIASGPPSPVVCLPSDAIGQTRVTDVIGGVRATDISETARSSDVAGNTRVSDVAGTVKSTDVVGVVYSTDITGPTRTTDTEDAC